MTDRLSAAQWSRFWTKGSITTFIGRFADNYDGKVRDFWLDVFGQLERGARVVDLATGNGGLALLAQQYSRRHDRGFTITAVDYADIDPPRTFAQKPYASHLRRIRFLARTPLEETGLPRASIDAAISQFGFEYGKPGPAVAEVDRILKPNGAIFAAMVHEAGSVIIAQARNGVEQIIACEKSGLHHHVTELLERLDRLQSRGKDAQRDNRARELRATINRVTEGLHDVADGFQDPSQIKFYLENTMRAFHPDVTRRTTLTEKLDALRGIAAETTAYRQRMRDLISSARSPADISTLEAGLRKVNFKIEISEPFVLEGKRFCHALIGKR